MSNVLNLVSEQKFVEQTDKIAAAITAGADEHSGVQPFFINFSLENEVLYGDKTFGQIYAAMSAGRPTFVKVDIPNTVTQTVQVLNCSDFNSVIQITIADNATRTLRNFAGAASEVPTIQTNA